MLCISGTMLKITDTDGSRITIKSLKEQASPSTPRKCDKTLRCAVVTKTPLKTTRCGKMFSMSLVEKDTSSTIRAICFEEEMFSQFQTRVTYDMKSFKLKRAFGQNSSEVEVLLDHGTSIEKSPQQFTVEKKQFPIAAILRKESQGFRFIDIKAKILAVEDVCMVGKHPNNVQKRDVELADESGVINMVLWRQRAVHFEFSVDDVILIENAVTTTFNNQLMLSTAFETTFLKIEESISVPPTGRRATRKRGLISTYEARVLGVKEFKAIYKCISCKGEIDHTPGNSGAEILLCCPACTTVFLVSPAAVFNKCSVLLSHDHEWYSANSGVSVEL